MSEFSILCSDFDDGDTIPEKFGYKFENEEPNISFNRPPPNTTTLALIMDDPDAKGAVGKVWLHWLQYHNLTEASPIEGKTDFGEIGYGGPAPPDGKTYLHFQSICTRYGTRTQRRFFKTGIRRCNERSYSCRSQTNWNFCTIVQ